MLRRITLYNLARRSWLPVLLIIVAYSFGSSTLMGSNGYFARQATLADLAEKTAELEALEEVRSALEKDVSLMSPSNLDPDLLDEQARSVLGLAGEKELIIMLDDQEIEPAPPED